MVMLAIDRDGSVCESIRRMVSLIKEKHGDDVQIIFGK
jgi:hypothetical protein